MLKANKNGVIVIRQTPNTNLSAKKAKPPPSAESKRSVHLSRNSSRRNSRNEDPSKFNNIPNNERKKSSTFRSSKSPSKSNQIDKLSKAKSFHELNNDLTPPRSPILPTRFVEETLLIKYIENIIKLVENTNLILEVIYFLGIHHLATQCHPINNLMNYCMGDKFLLEIRKRIELSHKIMSIKMELPILHKKILNSTFCVGIVSLPRPLMMNITTRCSSNCTRLKTGLYSLDILLISFSKVK